MSLAASKTALIVEVDVQLKAGKAICKMRVRTNFQNCPNFQKELFRIRSLYFTYLIVTAVFHKFHEVVTSDNTSRNNIH